MNKKIVISVIVLCLCFFGYIFKNKFMNNIDSKTEGKVDTLYVKSVDTIMVKDTVKIYPKQKFLIKVDTLTLTDTVKVVVEKVKEYVVEKTFEDSAFVRDIFLMDTAGIIVDNDWLYRPSYKIYNRIDTVKVKDKWYNKAFYYVGFFSAGFLVGAVSK